MKRARNQPISTRNELKTAESARLGFCTAYSFGRWLRDSVAHIRPGPPPT
jgi:hypothetical protein